MQKPTVRFTILEMALVHGVNNQIILNGERFIESLRARGAILREANVDEKHRHALAAAVDATEKQVHAARATNQQLEQVMTNMDDQMVEHARRAARPTLVVPGQEG